MTEREKQRLEKIRQQMALMKAQEQQIISREKKLQRKANTRRLIQIGAIAEKHLNCVGIAPQDFEKIIKSLVEYNGVKEVLEHIKKSLPQ